MSQENRFYAALVGIVLLVMAAFTGVLVIAGFHALSASVAAPPPVHVEARVIPHPAGCGCCDRCRR